MKRLIHILFVMLAASSVPALAQSEVISGLPGIDGISPILQVPAADPALSDGLFGEDLIDLPLLQAQIRISESVSGGLPGIDGLNFSPEAFAQSISWD